MKNKKIRRLLLLLIFFNLILLSALAVFSKTNIKENTESYEPYEGDRRHELIYPIGIAKFKELYTGNISEKNILERVTGYIYYIVDNNDYLKNISENQIKAEYEKNKEKLNSICVSDEESFRTMISITKKIDQETLYFSYIEFKSDTIKDINGITKLDIALKFTEFDEIIMTLSISDKYDSNNVLVSID